MKLTNENYTAFNASHQGFSFEITRNCDNDDFTAHLYHRSTTANKVLKRHEEVLPLEVIGEMILEIEKKSKQ